MKKISELKLNSLSKRDLTKKELERLQGGNYCAYRSINNYANSSSGLCSSSSGASASFMKYTTGWGQYC